MQNRDYIPSTQIKKKCRYCIMGVYYNPGGPCSPGGVGLLMSLPMLLENPGGPLRPGGGAIEDCTVVIPGGGGSENFGCSDSGGLCNGGGAIPGTPELKLLDVRPGGGVGVTF